MMRDIIGLVGEQLDDSGAGRAGPSREAGRRAGAKPEGVDTAAAV
jgi:hypothetical protein